jgi:hypothetical protein
VLSERIQAIVLGRKTSSTEGEADFTAKTLTDLRTGVNLAESAWLEQERAGTDTSVSRTDAEMEAISITAEAAQKAYYTAKKWRDMTEMMISTYLHYHKVRGAAASQ